MHWALTNFQEDFHWLHCESSVTFQLPMAVLCNNLLWGQLPAGLLLPRILFAFILHLFEGSHMKNYWNLHSCIFVKFLKYFRLFSCNSPSFMDEDIGISRICDLWLNVNRKWQNMYLLTPSSRPAPSILGPRLLTLTLNAAVSSMEWLPRGLPLPRSNVKLQIIPFQTKKFD